MSKMRCINGQGSEMITGQIYEVKEPNVPRSYYSVLINGKWTEGYYKTRFIPVNQILSLDDLRKKAFNVIKKFSSKPDSIETLNEFECALQDMAREVHNEAFNRVKQKTKELTPN